jgi:hypothetical protein
MESNDREIRNRFHESMVTVIWHRFSSRCKRGQGKLHEFRSDTWAKTLIRNRSKLKPRLLEPLKERRRSTRWDYAIAKQKIRVNAMLDPYVRWASREAKILKKVNERGFEQAECYSHGFTWTYVAAKQVEKMMLNRLPVMLMPRTRRVDWPGAQLRVWAEYKRLVKAPPEFRNPWDLVIYGARRKFNERLDEFAGWAVRIKDSCRRWAGERQ